MVRDGTAAAEAFLAVLELAQRGEAALAFRVMKSPDAVLDQLQAAEGAADPPRLAALATIVRQSTDDERVRRRATVALGISRARQHRAEEAGALVTEALEGLTDDERRELTAAVEAASARQPAEAAELAPLVEQLRGAGS
jgi:hypothetical protein